MTFDRDALQEQVLGRATQGGYLAQMQHGVFPDSAAEFTSKYLKSPKGAVLVSYAGAKVTRGEQPGVVCDLDLVVLARQRTGPQGGPALLGAIAANVEGARLSIGPFAFELEVISDGFEGEENKVSQYSLRVRCTSL